MTPNDALAASPEADSLQLRARDGQPIYVLGTNGKAAGHRRCEVRHVLGETSTPTQGASPQAFSGTKPLQSMPASSTTSGSFTRDSMPGRPYHRVTLDDSAGNSPLCLGPTGEVRRNHAQAAGAQLGGRGSTLALLDCDPPALVRLGFVGVVDLLLVALGSALLGFILGIYRYVQSRARGGSGWRVYVSWWRWHHVLGLTAGLFLLGWILSGWLSMDHGRLFSRGGASADAMAAMADGCRWQRRAEGVSSKP